MRRIWERERPSAELLEKSEPDISITFIEAENGPKGWEMKGILGAILRLFSRRK